MGEWAAGEGGGLLGGCKCGGQDEAGAAAAAPDDTAAGEAIKRALAAQACLRLTQAGVGLVCGAGLAHPATSAAAHPAAAAAAQAAADEARHLEEEALRLVRWDRGGRRLDDLRLFLRALVRRTRPGSGAPTSGFGAWGSRVVWGFWFGVLGFRVWLAPGPSVVARSAGPLPGPASGLSPVSRVWSLWGWGAEGRAQVSLGA